jgi:catechol 2,3-dioxygenase-like lactoylglutathione lyase family enzyme
MRTEDSPTLVEQDRPRPGVPPTIGFFEVVLEVADLAAAEHFYHDLLGLPIADRWTDDRPGLFLTLGGESFLGLWPPETGGERAIHQGRGGVHVHFAIRVPTGSIDTFHQRLTDAGYVVEDGWEFGPGNRAIYVDDPDGNVVELTERRTLWDGSPSTLEPTNPPAD